MVPILSHRCTSSTNEKFLVFLVFARDSKNKQGLTKMEKNLYNALKDPATLTELAVLALYALAISHPYICQIQGKDLNMLDLCPLHLDVKENMKKMIENPNIFFSADTTYNTSAVDGRKWERPEVVDTILKQAPELPHLSNVLVAFFKGTCGTWKCFTTEFIPGGVIGGATDLQMELAWIPATNDVNKGILGSLCQFMWCNPRATLHIFNTQTMCQRNDTQPFINNNFNEDDHKFLMQMAQEVDASGLEPKYMIRQKSRKGTIRT
jgi:hypothetical protein